MKVPLVSLTKSLALPVPAAVTYPDAPLDWPVIYAPAGSWAALRGLARCNFWYNVTSFTNKVNGVLGAKYYPEVKLKE